MKSFSLIKTNVGLTTNIKIIIDSTYNLFLDSIESSIALSNDIYKKIQFNSTNYYDELIPYFWNGLDSSLVFNVFYNNDNSTMYDTFDNQLDDLYISGCNDISDNQYYTEDYEYFAPLYISKTGLPKYFIIFRIDGPGIVNLNSSNFRTSYLNQFKCIKLIDLTNNTSIGQWLYNNITNNVNFPSTGFEMNFKQSEFSHWNGIDLINGNYTQKTYFFDTKLEYENTFNDLEKFIYDGYKTNNVVYPNILNLSFLFNDQPATTTSLRDWSINRYAGFYLNDMVLSKNVSTYLPSILLPYSVINAGNTITNPTFSTVFSESTLKLNQIYIEYLGDFYPVNYIDNNWRIIADIDLEGQQASINANIINIDSNNMITYINGGTFSIDNFDTADVWLIKINNKYHNIQYDNGNYYIYTDYGFILSPFQLTYYINYPDPNYSITINLISNTQSVPLSFPIYKCCFTDIKDIDDSVIDTQFSKFEYDIDNEIIQTDESKMHLTNLNDNNIPKNNVQYSINNLTANIPTTSHYTANDETFNIINDAGISKANASDLNYLWRKNPPYVKFGFKNSLSAYDYPYYLNNSVIGEDYNRTSNTYLSSPMRIERNLDYFYSINSSTTSYSYHSLHIEDIQNNTINVTYSFDVNQYLENEYDYFSLFFDKKIYLNNSTTIQNVSKFSYFNTGDNTTMPNITLFRGIKINAYDVTSVKIQNNILQTINISNNNTYDDYKFSILLSNNNYTINTNTVYLNEISLTYSNNTLSWTIIDPWKHEKQYNTSK